MNNELSLIGKALVIASEHGLENEVVLSICITLKNTGCKLEWAIFNALEEWGLNNYLGEFQY